MVLKHNAKQKKNTQNLIPLVISSRCCPLRCSHSASRSWTLLIALRNTSTGILEISSCIRSANLSVKYAWHCFLTVPVSWNDTQPTGEDFFFERCSHSVNVLWGENCFNTTTFLLNSWAGLFKVVYPRLYGMSWRHFTVSMNPEFLAKFTLDGNVAIVVLIKWFYGESTLCTSPRLHFKLNAIHGHATWQYQSPFPLKLKTEKHRCQISRFAGGPYT